MAIARIGARKPFQLFIAEWRLDKGLTQQELGDRMGKSDVTISRWETGKRKPSDKLKADIAYALGIEPIDLYRHPAQPSADALLRDQVPEVVEQAIRLITAIRR